MPYMSGTATLGLDRILDKISLCEINNKDLVIPNDELYIYTYLLEKVKNKVLEDKLTGK
tara:strand:- start:145 stop:321 length:177 start_codon:yes stop_codon:yes gene_type:complete